MYSKVQIHSLHEIARAAERLRQSLNELKSQTTQVLRKMEEGKVPGIGFGSVLSNQTPFEVAQYSERLQNKLQMASALKVEEEHAQWAYEMGCADTLSPYYEELWIKITALADAE